MYFQARITDIAKLEGKLDTENNARKQEIANLDRWIIYYQKINQKFDFLAFIPYVQKCINISLLIFSWAKGENDARKTEIANLDNFAHSENDARKNEIANLDNFAKSENDGRKQV